MTLETRMGQAVVLQAGLRKQLMKSKNIHAKLKNECASMGHQFAANVNQSQQNGHSI